MTPRRAIVLAFGVLCLGIGLAAVDTIHEGERFDAADFALELLEWAGIVGAVTAAVWIAIGLRGLRADQDAMRHDLARAVEQGADWRARHGPALDDRRGGDRPPVRCLGTDAGGSGHRRADAEGGRPARHRAACGIPPRRPSASRPRASTASRAFAGRAELAAYFLESLFEQRPQDPP